MLKCHCFQGAVPGPWDLKASSPPFPVLPSQAAAWDPGDQLLPSRVQQLANTSHQQLGRRAVCREAKSKGTESSALAPPSLRAVQEGRCPPPRVSLWGPPGRKETNVSVRCSGNYPHPPAWPGRRPGAPPRLLQTLLVFLRCTLWVPTLPIPLKVRKSGLGKGRGFPSSSCGQC